MKFATIRFAALGSLLLPLAIAPCAAEEQSQAGSAAKVQQVESQIIKQVRSFEQQLKQQEQVLQQKLERAAGLRQRALKDNNGEMLKQAEAIERDAVAEYQQQIERFETYSKRLGQATTERAQSQAATYNRQAPQQNPPSAGGNHAPQPRNRSILERRGSQQAAADRRPLEPVAQPEEEEEPRGWFRPLRRWFSK